MRNLTRPNLFLSIASVLLLSACGGGSSGPGPAPAPEGRQVQGAVTKGPVAAAQIDIYAFDRDGEPVGSPVASTSTDGQGRFTLGSVPSGTPLLVISSGGSFVDESDKLGERSIALGPNDSFSSILPDGATTVAINPVTQTLVEKVRDEALASGASFFQLIADNRTIFADAFGFDVLTTLPANPVAPTGSDASVRYAMVLGGVANAINALSAAVGETQMSYGTIRAFTDDLSDGRLDGQAGGAPVTAGGAAQAVPDVDFNLEIRRFRNNNDNAYSGRDPVVVDELRLATAGTPDSSNRIPDAAPDSDTVAEGATINRAAPGVLFNDSDLDGDSLTAVLETGPANAASFTLNADGSYDYTHDGSETSTDSFSYRASDGTDSSAAATVSLTITAVSDPPVVDTNTGASVAATMTVAITTSELTASDPDNTAAELGFTVDTPPSCGSFAVGGSASASFTQADIDGGQLAFDAATCVGGENLSIPLTLSDGTSNVALNFAVTVTPAPNTAPTGNNDSYAVNEGAVLNVADPGVLANDTDGEGDPLDAVLVSGPANASSFSLAPTGGFSYTHDGSETVSDAFSYTADDGQAQSGVTTVNLTINPVNDAPVVSRNNAVSVDEGLTVVIGTTDLQATDAEDGPAQLSFTISAAPSCGGWELGGAPTASFTQAQIDAGQVAYDANLAPACSGAQDVVTGFDLDDSAGGGPVALSYTVTINGSGNQAPVNTLPAGPLDVDINGSRFLTGISVSDPDADPTADTLTFSFSVSQGLLSFRTDVAGGLVAADFGGSNNSAAVVINATLDRLNATLAQADGLNYTPGTGFAGADSLQLDSDDNGNSGSGSAQNDIDNLALRVVTYELDAPSTARFLRLDGEPIGIEVSGPLTGLGDFNNDGVDDVLITGRFQGSDRAYVVFGNGAPPAPTASLGDVGMPFPDGFKLTVSTTGQYLGSGADGGVDFNNDGLPDLVLGAERTSTMFANAGAVYVVFGNAGSGDVDLDLLDGSNGFRIDGAVTGERMGSSVRFIGDVNGDGLPELAIGARLKKPGGRDNAGSVYVIFGSATPFPAAVDISTLADGSNGVRIDGAANDHRIGSALAAVDLNANGIGDLAIGVPLADPGGVGNAGQVFVVFGTTLAAGNPVIDLATLTPAQGSIIDGETAFGQLGSSVSGLPDLNGDGIADLAMGEPGASGGGGAHILFGAPAPAATLALSALNGANGFSISTTAPIPSAFGQSVAAAGDFDNDGLDDLLIGDPAATPDGDLTRDSAGVAWLLRGRPSASPFPAALDLNADDGSQVTRYFGVNFEDEFGSSLAAIGDFNADGRDDLASSAPAFDVGLDPWAGAVYLILDY